MNRLPVPRILGFILAVVALVGLGPVSASETHPGEKAFAARVAKAHGVSEQQVLSLLDQAERKQSIIDAMRRPAESMAWADYRKLFMTRLRIAGGVAFYQAHRELLQRVEEKYGVDAHYIVAILGVESNYGLNTGSYRVLDALVTLSFYYPSRASFFQGELEKLLTMPETQLPGPLLEIKGSYAGAMGWGQFMPTSVAAYARDEDDDGHIDLNDSLPDTTASIANYLAEHGWQKGQPVAVSAKRGADARAVDVDRSKTIHDVAKLVASGYTPEREVPGQTAATLLELDAEDGKRYWMTFNNFYVITRYNHSSLYAMAVTQLAKAIARDSNAVAPQADTAAASVHPARDSDSQEVVSGTQQ